MKDRRLCSHISDYGDRYKRIKDTLEKWYDEVRPMQEWENEEDFYSTRQKNILLNPIHYHVNHVNHVNKKQNVHSRIKNALHICL
jgi:exopolyphosphatase/pppGpp-phosphohydrolase